MVPTQSRVLVLLLTALLVSSGQADDQDVVFRVSYEGKPYYLINVTFTSSKFTEFYSCMCSGDKSSCLAQYDGDRKVNKIDEVKSTTSLRGPCLVYLCTNSGQKSQLNCSLQSFQAGTCPGLVQPYFLRLSSASSCVSSCVVVSWTLQEESLFINDDKVQVQKCDSECCKQNPATPPATGKPPVTTISPEDPTNTSSLLWQQESGDYLETYILSGVGAGLVLISLIVFLIIFLIRRRTVFSTGDTPRKQGEINSAFSAAQHQNGRTGNFFPGSAQRPVSGLSDLNDDDHYAVIDEDAIEVGSSGFLELDPDGGYSSTDQLDYYNLQTGDPALEGERVTTAEHTSDLTFDSTADGVDRVENPRVDPSTRKRKIGHVFSEYSVARPISQEHGDRSQEVDQLSGQVEDGGGPGQVQILRVGDGPGDSLGNEPKRHTYFELEKTLD